MKKYFFLFYLAISLILITNGCNIFPKAEPAPKETQITYLLSDENTDKYCNGAEMDSEGYRKTITQKKVKAISKSNLSLKEKVLETLLQAVNYAGLPISNNINDQYFKIIDDTAYIQPIEGWAGVSIFLCYWKPFIEVNLLQFPEIKKVEWVEDPVKWQELIEQ